MSNEQAKSRFLEDIQTICDEQSMRDYQAFPRWVCENVLDLDNGATDDAVIDGAGNYGIDIVHIEDNSDKLNQYVCIGQVKFNKTLNYRTTQEEVGSLINAWQYLENCPVDANEAFKQKSQEYKAIKKDNPNIQKITLFVVGGTLNHPAKTLVDMNLAKSLSDDHKKNPQLQIIEDKMIKIMRNLKKRDRIPEALTNVLRTTCGSFMSWFDACRRETYPSDIIKKMNNPQPFEYTPTPHDIVYKLKKHGADILSILKIQRTHIINIDKEDKIKKCLEVIE